MKLEPFLLERYQSTHEHYVDINLSESGVEPLTVRELIEDHPQMSEGILSRQLMYTQTNGTPQLRQAVARMYPGATLDHVEITNGGSEANLLVCLQWIEPGDHVVMMIPNYMQTWGLMRGLHAEVDRWLLVRDDQQQRWRVDLDRLEELIRPQTKAIVICNPNNPTGSCLTADELDRICLIAERVGAWVVSDEIYRGSELAERPETPTAWGRYDRVVVTSGLSKAYGLPGLRIGWLVAPPQQIEGCWSTHDYLTIAPGALSDYLATYALQPDNRERILQRTRTLLDKNLSVVSQWLESCRETIDYLPPQAGAMLYLHYRYEISSSELVERLRREKSVLLVAGDHYGMDGHLRIGFGARLDHLQDGIGRLNDLLSTL